jgi:lipopolysaccharide export system permease protein
VRLLDRYLFWELLTPLAYCLGGFLIFYTSFDLFTRLPDLQEHKLHLGDVLEYCVAQMPVFLVLVLPVALLLALLYTLTNHARHNEITAMRAAGISLWRICVPYFAVGVAVTAGSFALNEYLVPRSAEWAFRIKTRYIETPEDMRVQNQTQPIGVKNESAHRMWYIRKYNAHTTAMFGVTVHWPMPDGSSRQLIANSAVRTNGVWTFFDATEWSQSDPSELTMTKLLQTNVLAMPEFEETPKQIQGEIKMGNSDMFGTDTDTIPLREIWAYLQLNPRMTRHQSNLLLTAFYGRIAQPWTCLVVVFIAIPFGSASGRRNLFFGVAGSIFIVAGYLVAEKLSLALGTNGVLPAPLAAWLPNLLFAVMGLGLTFRVR